VIREDDRGDYISNWEAEMMRVIPIIGTTMPAYYSAFFENPYEAQKATSQFFGHIATELTGFGRAVGYNPYQERAWMVREIQERLDQAQKDVAGKHRRVVS